MRKRIMAMLLALVMVVGVLPVAALAEEPVSDTEPTTVPTETTAPTEATALAEAVQTDVSQYALTDGISTYDAFNCYVALIPDSTNAKPTGFKVKVGDTVNGYKVLSLNSRTYEVHIDIGVLQSESALPRFRIPLPEEIWTGVKATDSTWVLCVNHWKPGDTMKLDRGGNQMRYYSMGTEWYFALKFDANGGSGAPAAQTYTTDTASETSYTFTIPKTVPARKGYTFQGWSFEKNGTASYQPGETCTLTRPKDGAIASTLYAVWEEAVPSKPEWSDIRGEMQKVSVHVTCINPDVNHTDKTYPYQESTDDVIGYVQDSAGSYTCTVTVHLGRYRTNYNSDFNREHQFASSLTADVVLQYNGTGWVIASALPLGLKLTCGSAPTPDPPGQDVLGRLLVQVECDAITYHFTKTYQLDDGDYRLEKVDDNTYTVTVNNDGNGTASANPSTAEALTEITLTAKANRGYHFKEWQVESPTGLVITNNKFLMPDTNVAVKAIFEKDTSTGGGTGTGATTYPITVANSKNGDVTVSHKSAAKGTTVILTVDPDKGYVLDSLTVLDGKDKERKLTDKGDGKYSFIMPADKVTVEASFKEEFPDLPNSFSDLAPSDFCYDAVMWAVGSDITGGIGNYTFGPNLPCTRAQAVTFLWRAAGSPEPETRAMPFTDVPVGSYYYNAVLWAIENGITEGTSDTMFSPDATCSRAQIVTFLWRAGGSPVASGNSAFTDVASDAYYAAAVIWAEKNDVTGGIGGGLFGSNNNCTRAQIVTFIYRSVK